MLFACVPNCQVTRNEQETETEEGRVCEKRRLHTHRQQQQKLEIECGRGLERVGGRRRGVVDFFFQVCACVWGKERVGVCE